MIGRCRGALFAAVCHYYRSNETSPAGRSQIAAFVAPAVLLLMMFATEMERAVAASAVTRQVLQVQHVTMKTSKKFADVEAALEKIAPQLDPEIAAALIRGDLARVLSVVQSGLASPEHGAFVVKLQQ